MTWLQFWNCFPVFVLPRYGERGYRSDKLSCKIPAKKTSPLLKSGVILNELIIAHAAPKSCPAGDANRLPSEEKVVEEAALVLS